MSSHIVSLKLKLRTFIGHPWRNHGRPMLYSLGEWVKLEQYIKIRTSDKTALEEFKNRYYL